MDLLPKNELNDELNEEFILVEEKSITFLYWIWCKLSRVLEEYCCNGVCPFCGVTIGVYGSWCNTFAWLGVFRGWCGASARLAARLANGRAADKTAGGAVNGTTGEIDGRAAGRATGRAASRAAGKTAGGAAGRATSGAASRVVGGAIGKTNGGATDETNCRAADRTTGGVADRVTGGVWTDVTIILPNSLAYTPKLEKQNRQVESSFFYSCPTNVIQNVNFASYCL